MLRYEVFKVQSQGTGLFIQTPTYHCPQRAVCRFCRVCLLLHGLPWVVCPPADPLELRWHWPSSSRYVSVKGAGLAVRLWGLHLDETRGRACFSWEQLCLPGLCSVSNQPCVFQGCAVWATSLWDPSAIDSRFLSLSSFHLPHGQFTKHLYFFP